MLVIYHPLISNAGDWRSSSPSIHKRASNDGSSVPLTSRFYVRQRSRTPTAATTWRIPVTVTSRNSVILRSKCVKSTAGTREMAALCGLGYWLNGFRCFPWMALNYHMVETLNFHPSILQMVHSTANLPMVAKPVFGLISDAVSIGGGRRIPYIFIGVALQVASWSLLALSRGAIAALPQLLSSVLLANLGASITEVAQDALTADYGQKHRISRLQSHAFMASVAGAISGNLLSGLLLPRTHPGIIFSAFSILLSVQLCITMTTIETSLGLALPYSGGGGTRKQFSKLLTVVKDAKFFCPFLWGVASVAVVPILSGPVFCYQTQVLNVDPFVVGLSRVFSQVVLLGITMMYDQFWRRVSPRRLVGVVQAIYASSLLLDLVLVKRVNLLAGIPNQVFVLCFSGMAEAIAQFRLLPIAVLLVRLSPLGSAGSAMAVFASATCLSSILGGFMGVWLARVVGISCRDYSNLPAAITLQFFAALAPLVWISSMPSAALWDDGKEKTGPKSRRLRKTRRRVGRLVLDRAYVYRPQRELYSQPQM